ncbi:redoxin domain-containing protein [Maribellus sp. CM-23]|uniref:peroxiredoxin family protein n=1 Tax=Maribellus sp. CM-23 TaxID=2781026 RepID=UPI001F4332D6|nr:redoxin domain-containing protein [Maribellus sp. CM-23]MCE4563607.1 redoxin domain-containing protein [Maribellus sp. CM-23]
MALNKFSFLLVVLFLLAAGQAQSVEIRCQNAEYAKKTIEFFTYSDPVSGKTETAFTLQFDASGKAVANTDVKETKYVFSDFGVFRGMLFLEAGKNIELKLPPFKEKSFADEKNPYFSPVPFWFITENKNVLTDKVSEFDQFFNYLTDKYFNQLYIRQSKAAFDSIKTELDKKVPDTAAKTLIWYKNLKLKLIEADIFRMRPEAYSSELNAVTSEYWLHPAFMELFNKTFDRQLSFSAQAIRGSEVKKAVETRNLPAVKSFVENKYKVSGKMAELVLLKLLHDAYYSDEFSKAAIKELVRNPLFVQNSNSIIKTATKNILDKFGFMATGSKAPVVCLNDLDGQKKCTNKGQSKFKYIVFADVETRVCQEQLKYLSRIDELFNKHLEIYVILRNTGQESIHHFFNEQKVPAEKLVDTDNEFIDLYKIRSFPQCFLLNEKHEVVFEHVKTPLDGFEQQFGEWLRNELFMRQRNQSK